MKYIKLEYDYYDTLELHNKKLLKKDQLFTIKSKQFPQQGLIVKVYDYSCIDGLPILEIDDKIGIDEIINIESIIDGNTFIFNEISKLNSKSEGQILDHSNRYTKYFIKFNIIVNYLLEVHNITKDTIENNDSTQLIRDIKINMINDTQPN